MNSPISIKLHPMVLAPLLIGGLVAAVYGAWFLYEVISASVGRGGYKYALELPPVPPTQVKQAPFCSQMTTKWVGCF
jgi:hypothetical protein